MRPKIVLNSLGLLRKHTYSYIFEHVHKVTLMSSDISSRLMPGVVIQCAAHNQLTKFMHSQFRFTYILILFLIIKRSGIYWSFVTKFTCLDHLKNESEPGRRIFIVEWFSLYLPERLIKG